MQKENQMKRGPSSERNLRNSVSSLRKKIGVLNGIVTRALAIPVRYSNQQSYEATACCSLNQRSYEATAVNIHLSHSSLSREHMNT